MTMACEVTPFITTTRVEYSGTTANVSEVVNKTRLNADGSNWPLLLGPAQTLAMISYSSQGMTDNFIVNSMSWTMAKLASNNVTAESMVESYVRGMVEYWATMHRTLLYIDASPTADMMIPMNGTMHVLTMGWQYDAKTYSFALVPITIVMLLTTLAVLIGYLEKRKVPALHDAHQSFDPSNPLDIIFASRSGEAPNDHKAPQVQLKVHDNGQASLMGKDSEDVDERKVDEERGIKTG
ncbi:hypothetical protein PAXINDRAFT_18021 [Paxillus involutus ATCC 200175]|uniref:Uncharacterized protein n=1 Tax=Paxillus involutus ATCC 200175 TaxID=664439 RepID=A0A0C9SZU1_PAXIN|nr:hypothetical protein PAXINDRAFT_18021 [Paxillus involutus ATCC 200175]